MDIHNIDPCPRPRNPMAADVGTISFGPNLREWMGVSKDGEHGRSLTDTSSGTGMSGDGGAFGLE
jgi:hypothetical protein